MQIEKFTEIVERLKSEWAERNAMIEEMRELRFMLHGIDAPEAVQPEKVRMPKADEIVGAMVGVLTTDPFSITVPPASEKAASQEQSSLMETWAMAALHQLEMQADTDVVAKFVETLIADGHGCMRMLHAPQLWKGAPRRKRKKGKPQETDEEYNERTEDWKRGQSLPIVWTWCDPLTIYPLWGEFGLEAVLEEDTRDVLTLDTRHWDEGAPELGELSKAHRGTGGVKFQQLWTRDKLVYAVEGKIVRSTTHRYGTPPYAYATGLGAATSDPKYKGYSVYWVIRHLIPYLDRLLSQKGTYIRMRSWPSIVFKSTGSIITDDGTPVLRNVKIAPGESINLYPDEEISFLDWKGTGPDADEMIQLVMASIDRVGVSSVMQGQSMGDSGYAINQLIAAARMRYKPIVAHAERALQQQVRRLFDIVEFQIKQPVHVYDHGEKGGWLTLAPDDLKGYRQVKVRLNPLMPTDTYARSSQALNEVRGGLRSRSGAMEMIGIEQPDEEMRKIRVDRWMNRPEIDSVMTQEAAKRLGLELAQGDLSMGGLQKAYPGLPGALQGELSSALQGAAPPGRSVEELGMRPAPQGPGGQPGMQGQAPTGAAMQAGGPGPLPQLSPQAQQAVQMIAQRYGVPPQTMLQVLARIAQQRGIPLETFIRMVLEQLRGGGQGGMPPQAGQRPPTPGQGITAAPGVAAVPTPEGGIGHVGPVTRPSGIAMGREPGVRRTGEGR